MAGGATTSVERRIAFRTKSGHMSAMTAVDYETALARYRDIVAASAHDTVKGKANPYTSLNGNMFSFLDKSGVLCLRLSKSDHDAFVETHRTEPVLQYGAVMKGYVAVPEAIASDPKAIQNYFEICLENARTLKPKPTQKR